MAEQLHILLNKYKFVSESFKRLRRLELDFMTDSMVCFENKLSPIFQDMLEVQTPLREQDVSVQAAKRWSSILVAILHLPGLSIPQGAKQDRLERRCLLRPNLRQNRF